MQKKLLLVGAVLISGLASMAQVQKKDWLLGGTFAFNNSTNSTSGTTSSSNSNLDPSLGFAVSDHSVIGLMGGVSFYSSKYASGDKYKSNGYSAGAYWKHFFPVSDKAGWFTNLSATYGYGKNTNTPATGGSPYSSDGNGFTASFAPGIYYKPSKKIFLNAGIGRLSYNHYKNSSNGYTEKSSQFNVYFLNAFNFGVDFILSKDHQM